MGETREVVEAVLYLKSVGFMTGETLDFDSGGAWRVIDLRGRGETSLLLGDDR